MKSFRTFTRKLAAHSVVLAVAVTAMPLLPATARADSCWNHNGSLMRLKAQGNQRWFYYEVPRRVLRNAGVRRGTLLFNGRKSGNWYSGTARVFSKWCEAPLEYSVEGPVASNQLKVTVRGTRPVFAAGCKSTGRFTTDTLVFTYRHDC